MRARAALVPNAQAASAGSSETGHCPQLHGGQPVRDAALQQCLLLAVPSFSKTVRGAFLLSRVSNMKHFVSIVPHRTAELRNPPLPPRRRDPLYGHVQGTVTHFLSFGVSSFKFRRKLR
jgi:hypothetical protein